MTVSAYKIYYKLDKCSIEESPHYFFVPVMEFSSTVQGYSIVSSGW
jgi:hypothetical protein